jgi:hypothetical protein
MRGCAESPAGTAATLSIRKYKTLTLQHTHPFRSRGGGGAGGSIYSRLVRATTGRPRPPAHPPSALVTRRLGKKWAAHMCTLCEKRGNVSAAAEWVFYYSTIAIKAALRWGLFAWISNEVLSQTRPPLCSESTVENSRCRCLPCVHSNHRRRPCVSPNKTRRAKRLCMSAQHLHMRRCFTGEFTEEHTEISYYYLLNIYWNVHFISFKFGQLCSLKVFQSNLIDDSL